MPLLGGCRYSEVPLWEVYLYYVMFWLLLVLMKTVSEIQDLTSLNEPFIFDIWPQKLHILNFFNNYCLYF